jgi:hypothetical protein
MLTYREAESIAQAEIDIPTAGRCVLLREYTISKPYGWVFFYQSRKYVETRNPDEALMGNLPFLIDRFDGRLRYKGRGRIETFLAEYEATLPPERLKAPVEEPPAAN